MVLSQCICPVCGTEISVPRIHNQQRKNGHIKDLYCPICKAERKCREVKYNQFYKNMAGEVLI